MNKLHLLTVALTTFGGFSTHAAAGVPGEFALNCQPTNLRQATISDYDLKITAAQVVFENGELLLKVNPGQKSQEIFGVDTAENITATTAEVAAAWSDEDTTIDLQSKDGLSYKGVLTYREDFPVNLSCVRTAVAPAATSSCGLPDTTNDLEDQYGLLLVQSIAARNLGRSNPRTLAQILAATATSNVTEAIDRVSNADDGYLRVLRFAGAGLPAASYTLVRFYPGDNEYGAIFADGSTQPVATIGDGDIACVGAQN